MTMPDVNCPECGGIYQLPAGTICKTCNRKHSPFIALMQEQARESDLVTALREENERLREALRFYADEDNYRPYPQCCGNGNIHGCCMQPVEQIEMQEDEGQRAREALGEKNG